MKDLVKEIRKTLGPEIIISGTEPTVRKAILLLAEEIEKLKVQQNSIDRRTSGLKLYGKIL